MKRFLPAATAILGAVFPVSARGFDIADGQPMVCCVVAANPPVIVRRYEPAAPRVFAAPPPIRVALLTSNPAAVLSAPVSEVAVEDDLQPTGDTMDDRSAGLRAARRVIVGGGYGALMVPDNGALTLGSAYRFHLGLALHQLEVGLRLDMAPHVLDLAPDSRGAITGSYLIGGLGFGFHFNPDGLFHPVVGTSLELHTLDPSRGRRATGFGAGVRAGIEMEYPLDFGSLGVGLDVAGHRRLVSDERFDKQAASALAFGGTIDYRF